MLFEESLVISFHVIRNEDGGGKDFSPFTYTREIFLNNTLLLNFFFPLVQCSTINPTCFALDLISAAAVAPWITLPSTGHRDRSTSPTHRPPVRLKSRQEEY